MTEMVKNLSSMRETGVCSAGGEDGEWLFIGKLRSFPEKLRSSNSVLN